MMVEVHKSELFGRVIIDGANGEHFQEQSQMGHRRGGDKTQRLKESKR
jgi:hypothetical protein